MSRRALVSLSALATIGAAVMLAFAAVPASAAAITSFTISPWAYACGHTSFGNPITKMDTPDENGCNPDDVPGTAAAGFSSGKLSLSKLCTDVEAATCTKDDLASGATVGGIVHLTAFSYDVDGYCGAGAPRLNVVTADDKTHFFGCSANNHNGHVTVDFSAAGDGSGNGGVSATDTVKSIDFVFDEAGSTVVSNIAIEGTAAATATPTPPTTTSATARASATTTTVRLALTGGGASPFLPIGAGALLIVLGVSAFVIRRRARA